MSLNKFKLLSESDDHFELEHPKGEKFKVSKGKLTPVAVQAIQGLAKGGCVGYADGGTAQVPYYLAPQYEPQQTSMPNPADRAVAELAKPVKQMDFAQPQQTQEQIIKQRAQELAEPVYDPATGLPMHMSPQGSRIAAIGEQLALAQQKDEERFQQQQVINKENAMRAQLGLAPVPDVIQKQVAAPAAPTAPQYNPFQERAGSMEDLYGQQKKDIESYKQDILAAQSAQQEAQKQLTEALQNRQFTPEDIAKQYAQRDAELYKKMSEAKVNPDNYWKDKSTGQKVMSAIALVLGGLAGRGQGNVALDMLNRAIDNDINSQKADISKTMNLYQMNRQMMRDDMQAELTARNQLYTMAQLKMTNAAQLAQNANARFQIQNMFNQLEQQKAQNRYQLALMQGGQPGAQQSVHPANLVPILMANASPAEREKAYKEIQAAENTATMADSILKNFDEAVKQNTVLKTGAGLLRTPPAVLAFHQALMPTFHDLEGAVREANIKSTKENLTPLPGDTEYTSNYKRNSVKDYIKSKMSAPVTKAYGINLEMYPTTSTNPTLRKSPQIQSFDAFARANPHLPISQDYFKKEGIQ